MSGLSIAFESGEASLEVREFDIREAMSECFQVRVIARSRNDDLDLDALVGHGATFTLESPRTAGRRVFRGVCTAAEQIAVESSGLSTYEIVVGPKLALLAHRSRYRVFQHLSIPEIVLTVFGEWNLHAEAVLDRHQHPKLECRVQLAETDLAFVSRLLEEAGISFTFPTPTAEGEDAPDLILEDSADAKPVSAVLAHLEHPSHGTTLAYAAKVRVGRNLRTGRVVLSDQSLRSPATSKLYGEAHVEGEARLERYEHVQGASVVVTDTVSAESPVADARGSARGIPQRLDARAALLLGAESNRRRQVSFETNALELRPGLSLRIEGHPRADFQKDRLLIIELLTQGSASSETTVEARALFTDSPYRPLAKTPKPRVHGIQTAVVVGPTGATGTGPVEEIHTDELGRVRVQFPWDREGTFDDRSSCWLRVSQAWAGGGHSAFSLPRVGDEVIVGFFDANPDQPVVIGRLHNASAPVPYPLPASKSISTWRTASTPATGGFNELRFDDAAGRELVFVQAERDYARLVKHSESVTVGASRAVRVGQTDDTTAGLRHSISIAPLEGAGETEHVTRIVSTPSKIVLTTGQATVTLDGPNVTFEALGTLVLKGNAGIRLESSNGDVVLQGGPFVRINPRGGGEPIDEAIPLDLPVGQSPEGFSEEIAEVAEHAFFDPERPTYFDDETKPGGALDPFPRDCTPEQSRFHTFKYAVAGRALGIPEGVLARKAGARHLAAHGPDSGRGSPGNGLFGGEAPYGSSDEAYDALKRGFTFYTRQYT